MLQFSTPETAKLHALIAPFVHPSMQYKLLSRYQGRFDVEPAFVEAHKVLVPMAIIMIGALSLRTSGMHFIMITLAFAQMLYYFAVGLEKYGGDDGLSLYSRNQLAGMDLASDMQFFSCALSCPRRMAFSMASLACWIGISRYGNTFSRSRIVFSSATSTESG